VLTWRSKKFEIEPSGKATPDITGDDFIVEVETGLKRRQDDLAERIEKAKNEGKVVFIVVPNNEVKKMYRGSMTIPEFSTWMDEAENYGIREEAKEEMKNE
jgi:predicted metal-dependent phosphoesterase TrpH